ncbi:MAG TPA: glycosyltransferase family 2 protein [Gammaproteobacteria bacterium]|jgi:glycosyltransferase involved in cell wall biosynthesis|nr:glycosyltransferase family 2 protein [Gammaproteobacteria bacterium]
MWRVIMTLLVRNEADIIADNIRYHARKGVDGFVVMDNGSTDGTLDILQNLANDVDLILITNPDGVYQQAVWMTELARTAKDKLGADFVISNDADEFWVVDDCAGSYRDCLQRYDSVVTVPRINAVFDEAIFSADYHYLNARYGVRKPLSYSKKEQMEDDNVCMQLVPVGPKVIVRAQGLIRVKGGNHRAKHWNPLGKRQASSMQVVHFPIRSYDKFLENVRHRAALLEKGAHMGVHYRRWVGYYKRGMLEEEFNRMVVTHTQAQYLEKLGVLAPLHHDIAP